MPAWVNSGYDEYAKRLPKECQLLLHQVTAGKRLKNTDLSRLTKLEGEKLVAAIPKRAYVVALDVTGKAWTTFELSVSLKRWMALGQPLALLVGGPEGLADDVRQKASEAWSLSPLTFPHPLVRVVVAEQIYRAWTILSNHPYHRE